MTPIYSLKIDLSSLFRVAWQQSPFQWPNSKSYLWAWLNFPIPQCLAYGLVTLRAKGHGTGRTCLSSEDLSLLGSCSSHLMQKGSSRQKEKQVLPYLSSFLISSQEHSHQKKNNKLINTSIKKKVSSHLF